MVAPGVIVVHIETKMFLLTGAIVLALPLLFAYILFVTSGAIPALLYISCAVFLLIWIG